LLGAYAGRVLFAALKHRSEVALAAVYLSACGLPHTDTVLRLTVAALGARLEQASL
jgi:hypothetical protein